MQKELRLSDMEIINIFSVFDKKYDKFINLYCIRSSLL